MGHVDIQFLKKSKVIKAYASHCRQTKSLWHIRICNSRIPSPWIPIVCINPRSWD